jgi:AraC-like DNA-binding protein
MVARNPIPRIDIASYLERILVIEDYAINTHFTLPLFANGMPTLLFVSAPSLIDGKTSGSLTLFGQTIFPEKLTITDRFTFIAYFFKPFALQELFGVSAQELTDHPIDLRLLSKLGIADLEDRLLHAKEVSIMINLLDDFISRLILKNNVHNKLMRHATDLISRNPTAQLLTFVQKELFVTERTFQRKFKASVGLSPERFRRICQFNTAFEQLNHRRYKHLSDIAFDNGFADQSHFIRTFKEFTDLTPREYLRYGEP